MVHSPLATYPVEGLRLEPDLGQSRLECGRAETIMQEARLACSLSQALRAESRLLRQHYQCLRHERETQRTMTLRLEFHLSDPSVTEFLSLKGQLERVTKTAGCHCLTWVRDDEGAKVVTWLLGSTFDLSLLRERLERVFSQYLLMFERAS